MGHRQHWEASIYTGERSKNSPCAQHTRDHVDTCMHKQGNWEERLEGRGNTEKLLEKQGRQDLTEPGYMSCSYGVHMTWHWHGFDVTVVALSTLGASRACKFHVAWENPGPKRLWQC
jgi:1-aminocyclopropane-1-carboxylate deaminase/D-cysteine desulfhydrase-like pyridoxal-dependent ACC family enzyme